MRYVNVTFTGGILSSGDATVQAELAGFMAARGLMHRMYLAPGHGMLFTFKEEALHAFWMKSTYLPLDLIFMNKHGVVVDIKQGEPLSEAEIVPAEPAMFVLEIAQGWAAENKITIGANAEIGDYKYE